MKKEKKKDKNNVLLIVGLLLLIVIVGVGYAVLESTLNINGTANIGTNSWNVHFENVSVTSGSVTATETPTTSGTNTLSVGYTVTLANPGDFYEFTIDVKNSGSLGAKLKSTAKTGAESYNFIKYTVTKNDGTAIPSNMALAANSSEKLKVRVEFDRDAVTPEILATISNLSLSLTYQMVFEQA